MGDYKTKMLEDKWTVITADRSLACHFEHTVAVTKDGPRILTLAA
jgi:methionyl aminopeptidase